MVIPLPCGGRLQPVQWLSLIHLPCTLGLRKNFVQTVMFWSRRLRQSARQRRRFVVLNTYSKRYHGYRWYRDDPTRIDHRRCNRGHAMTQHPVLSLIDAIDPYVDRGPLQHRELAGIGRRLQERLRPATVAKLAPVAANPRSAELQPAFDLAHRQGAADLIDRLAAAQVYLDWVSYDSYPAAEIGSHFPRRHLFTSLIELVDPNWSHDFDFGLLWIASHTLYRDHHHPAPELYLPLT